MTSYHGGKQRIGKKLAEIIYDESIIIEEEEDFVIKGYCEPFCGMLGVYQHTTELFSNHTPKLKYKAGDINKSVVKMWQEAQTGWKPPTKCTKKQFDTLKYDGKSSAIKGFVGHVCTYRGVYFDGFFQHKPSKINNNVQNVMRIGKQVQNVQFSSGMYTQYSNLKNYVIYCDPPYKEATQRYFEGIGYTDRLDFDHKKFWEWCRKMAENNIVFVSEYSAPPDIEKIFSSSHRLTSSNKDNKRVEKLYIV